MERIVSNCSFFPSDGVEDAVRFLMPTHVIEGYGPSYGVDNETLYALERGEQVAVPCYDAWLTVKRTRQTVGPCHASYTAWLVDIAGPDRRRAIEAGQKTRREAFAFVAALWEWSGFPERDRYTNLPGLAGENARARNEERIRAWEASIGVVYRRASPMGETFEFAH